MERLTTLPHTTARNGKMAAARLAPVLALLAVFSAVPGLPGAARIASAGEIRQADGGRNCTCRFFGTDYKLGETVCLRGPDGPRMARCSMNLNNTAWKTLERSCPTSQAPGETPDNPDTMTALAGLPAAH